MKKKLLSVGLGTMILLSACGTEEESDTAAADDLSETLAQIETENEGLNKKIEELERENDELKEQDEETSGGDEGAWELKKENEELKTLNSELQAENDELTAEVGTLEGEKGNLSLVASLEEGEVEEEEDLSTVEIDDFSEEMEPASEDDVPMEWQAALESAYIYAELMHMSKAGIYNQLVSEYGEDFPADAAQYAVDTMEWGWKENALESAKTYREIMSMSNAAIYDQLISEYGEQFTHEEAQYAVDNLD